MRRVVLIGMLLALTGAGSIVAQPHAAAPLVDDLTIAFSGRGTAAGGVLDLGAISHATPGSPRGKTIRREEIAIVVSRRSGARGTVRLQAWVSMPDAKCTIRVDGIPLGTAPVVIDPQVQLGTESIHRIEVEVPVSAPEGPVAASIQWEVTTQ